MAAKSHNQRSLSRSGQRYTSCDIGHLTKVAAAVGFEVQSYQASIDTVVRSESDVLHKFSL